MQAKLLKKEDIHGFLEKLRVHGELIAPVDQDILRFSMLKDVTKFTPYGRPLFSAKKYFYDGKRKVFDYKKEKLSENLFDKKYVLFGLRLCDINSLSKLDKLFLNEVEDQYYKKAREKNIVIGLNCEKPPTEYCFCESMNLKDEGYDLFFCDVGGYYHIKVGSKRGEGLVKELKDSNLKPKPIKTGKKLNNKDIKEEYSNKLWKEQTKKCIGCGACTNLCPNCLCFDIFDTPNQDMVSGSRNLEWDSCQYKDFTKVAGGHVFRDNRESRLKHRIYHKIQYFNEQFDEYMCTGCGRCIEGCPTRIDFVDIINKIKSNK